MPSGTTPGSGWSTRRNGVPIESEDLVERVHVVLDVVEHQFPIVVGIRLRNHVEEVELRAARLDGDLDDPVQDGNVLLVDADIDVDDGAFRVADRTDHALQQFVERSGSLGEVVVQLGSVTVQRVGDLAQSGITALPVEGRIGQTRAIRDRLDPVVADLLRVPDELREERMQARLSSRDDDLVRPEFLDSASEIRLHLFFREVDVSRGVCIQTEEATGVARRDTADPVLGSVRDGLAREPRLIPR